MLVYSGSNEHLPVPTTPAQFITNRGRCSSNIAFKERTSVISTSLLLSVDIPALQMLYQGRQRPHTNNSVTHFAQPYSIPLIS